MFIKAWKEIEGLSNKQARVWHKLMGVKANIKVRQKFNYRLDERKIRQLEMIIHDLELDLQDDITNNEIRNQILKLKSDLRQLLWSEKRSWQQKLRVRWVLEGDKSTKYFHVVTFMRRKVNSISRFEVNRNLVDELEVKKLYG